MDNDISLKDILKVYNSISPSRTRWVRNRNTMRNQWKELFKILEQASGREGMRAGVFDANWHKVTLKGGIPGAANKEDSEITRVWTPELLPVVEEIGDVELETPDGDLIPIVSEDGGIIELSPLEETTELTPLEAAIVDTIVVNTDKIKTASNKTTSKK